MLISKIISRTIKILLSISYSYHHRNRQVAIRFLQVRSLSFVLIFFHLITAICDQKMPLLRLSFIFDRHLDQRTVLY